MLRLTQLPKGAISMTNAWRAVCALIASAAVLSGTVSCSDKEKNNTQDNTEQTNNTEASATENVKEPMDIIWLSDYDIKAQDSKCPTAVAMFEEIYGGEIKYIQTTPDEKLSKLSEMLTAGETVDMFPYDDGVFPAGIRNSLFQPLDPYYEQLGMNEGLWDDMSDVIDSFAYNGEHYVVPYALSEPFLLTYSRKLMQSEGIDDPYSLFKEGKWDWNAMNDMINKFASTETSLHHFGISGFFGEAALSSTGHTVINFDGNSFTNNISDPQIEKAEALMQDIQSRWLYNSTWSDMFPHDMNTLFYASRDWSLPISNKYNADYDIMAVPFPKAPDADKYYVNCRANARMLVNGSQRGGAVAAYLKCERLAVTEFREAAKEQALKNNMTEEQYDAVQEYLDPSKVTPVFDFGYGMSSKMYGNGNNNFDTRGVMNNVTSALLEGGAPVGSWGELRDKMSPVIDEELKGYSKN